MTPRRWLFTILAAAAVLLVVGRIGAGLYADYGWYHSLGATSVWRAKLAVTTVWRLVAWFVAGAFAFGHLLTVRRSVVSLVLQRRMGNIEIGETVPARYLSVAAAGLAIVIGGALALAQGEATWTTALLARMGTPFGEVDPYFDEDIGFFVSWLPFETDLWAWAVFVLLSVVGVVLTLYVLTDGLRIERGRLSASSHVRRHLAVMVGIGLLLLAWHFRIAMYELLLTRDGGGRAFSFHDHQVGIPGMLVLSLATLGAGLVVIWTGGTGQFKLSMYALATVFVIWVLARQVAPVIAGQLGPAADAVARDRQYVATQAGYTRRAFGVDRIREGDSSVVFLDRAAAAAAVQLWDPPALRRAIVSAREPDSASSWIGWRASPRGLVADVVIRAIDPDNRRLPWVVARVSATQVGFGGGPVEIDHAALGTARRRGVERSLHAPIVFPGADGHLVVTDSLRRIAGASVERWAPRVAYAWSLQNPRFMGGIEPTARPVLVTHRDVRERVARIAPFFTQGTTINPVLVGGQGVGDGDSLFWVVDLYSTSTWYPLSHRVYVAGRNNSYFHHAAVAIVDAERGEVTIVPDARPDPIAATWLRRFPTLFGSWASLPPDLRAALPPPIDAARAQAIAVGRFGTPSNSGVPRHLPGVDGSDTALTTRDPVFMLPDRSTTATAIALVDSSERVRGALVVTGGGSEMRSVWVVAAEPLLKWTDILDRLRAADSAGRDGRLVEDRSLRSRSLARGRVRVVPIGTSLAFIQPVFDWRSPNAPALEYVSYAIGDSTAVATSLRAAWADSAGAAAPGGVGGASPDAREQISNLVQVMRSALQRGDWAAFGRAFDSLSRLTAPRAGRER
jgi:uncharacterized membrane protein (UPF0182 family)